MLLAPSSCPTSARRLKQDGLFPLGTGELETQGERGHGPKVTVPSVPWEHAASRQGSSALPSTARLPQVLPIPSPCSARWAGALLAASPEQGVSGVPWGTERCGRGEGWAGWRCPLLKHCRLLLRPVPSHGAPSQHRTGPTELRLQACGCCCSPALHHLLVLLLGLLDHLEAEGEGPSPRAQALLPG